MSEYLHGAYGDTRGTGSRIALEGQSAIVCVGTAPVHTAAAGGDNVNRPVVVRNFAEAKKYFGYSDDWASWTLCEAMHYFFEVKGIGPLVMINTFDPMDNRGQTATTVTHEPGTGGKIADFVVADGIGAIQNDLTVTQALTGDGSYTLVRDTDYEIAYEDGVMTVRQIRDWSVNRGTSSATVTGVTISYKTIDMTQFTTAKFIGTTDGIGTNTGLYTIKNVYPLTGYIPGYMIAPGFGSIPAVHEAMAALSHKVNGHWDMWMFVDLPLMNGSTPLTMATVAEYKAENGFNKANETVYFPMALGVDGKKYHLSVLAAANFLELLAGNDDVPYHSASNTEAAIISRLWLGSEDDARVFDDEIINENLNKHGIASAAFVGGRWAIWGAHAADYTEGTATLASSSETNRMMLYYLSNDFQRRRPVNVDQPLTANDIASIVSEEQRRLDALVAMGALLYGRANLDAESIADSDVYKGDFVFEFQVTASPLAKSLKAIVTWTDQGFSTYYETFNGVTA